MIDFFLNDLILAGQVHQNLTRLTSDNSLRADSSVFCSLTAVDKSAFFTTSTFFFITNKVGETD